MYVHELIAEEEDVEMFRFGIAKKSNKNAVKYSPSE